MTNKIPFNPLSKGGNGSIKETETSLGFYIAILGFVLLIPLWVLGWSVALQIIRFMKSPIINGMIPVWVVFVVLIVLFIFMNKNR